MGKQRGLYLTSGLKHSFRRGKGKKEDGAGEPFSDQSEITPTPPQPLPFAEGLHLQGPCGESTEAPKMGTQCPFLSGSLGNCLFETLETILVTYGCLDEEVALWTSLHPGVVPTDAPAALLVPVSPLDYYFPCPIFFLLPS